MQMRIVIGTLLFLLAGVVVLVIATAGSGDDSSSAIATGTSSHPTQVVAAFYPIAFAAEEIGGDKVSVENLTPPGAEPHDLEVTPRDVSDLQSADLDLLMGEGFQPQLESAAGGQNALRLLDTPGLDLTPGDPHVWLDPVRFQKIVDVIGEKLGDPEAANALDAKLAALDGEFRAGLSNCNRHEIVTSHEAFRYLADRYGLEQVAISGISPEAEPTPSDLERAANAVHATGATTVFTETLASPKLAQTVARETGAKTAVLNPIEGLTQQQRDDGKDYFALMRENLAALEKALDCGAP
jgi:zinc transport system substrate-binding protein